MDGDPTVFRDVSAALLDVVYVLQIEPEMRLEYVSDSVLEFSGFTAQEYLADPALWQTAPDPRDSHLLQSALNAEPGVATHFTLRWVGRGGKIIWTQQNTRKIRRADGSVALLGALNHVTSRQIIEARAGIDGRYQMLAEDASDVVLQTDLDGRIAWVSDSIEALAGWAPESLVGQVARELVDERDVPLAAQIRVGVLGGDSYSGVILLLRTADGGRRYVSLTVRPARDAYGRVEGGILGLRDVDEVVRARLEAESERQVLRATLDAMLDPHVLLESVRDDQNRVVDFRCVQANPAACQALGSSNDQLEGALLSRIAPTFIASPTKDRLVALLETREPLVLNNHPQDLVSGGVGYYDLRAVAVHDGLTVTWRDVTQRYEEAAALAQSEARWRLLLEESSDMVSFHTPAGQVQWVSPAVERLLGWPPEQVNGPALLDLVHRDDGLAIAAARDRLLSGEGSASARFRMRTTAGGFRWLEATARAVRDDQGEVTSLVVVTHDIQAQMDYEQALAESRQRYQLLAEHATDVVYRTTLDGVTEWISEGVERILGFPPEHFIGRSGHDVICHEDREFVDAMMAEVLAGTRQTVRFRMLTNDGGQRWVDATVHAVRDERGQPVGFVGGWRDVQAEVEAEQVLDRRARTDDLTGLLNRREVFAHLAERLRPGAGTHGQIAVVFCDLDNFKTINDRMGHAVGDRILQVVSDRIQACVRTDDLIARVGGDEILLVLSGVTHLEVGTAVAEEVRRAVSEPLRINGQDVPVTMSVGVTLADERDDLEVLLARADRAMYLAKESGRDQVVPLG